MTEAAPHGEGAEIDVPHPWRSLPEPALGGVAATWQAILRVRHPEFTGLVVEVTDETASGTAGAAHRATPHVALEVVANASVRGSGAPDPERTAARGR